MRIVVVGGTGRIGSKVVAELAARGHDAVAAAPSTGVDAVTGAGLADVLTGASAVVDTSSFGSSDCTEARGFFATTTLNLLAAEAAAGVDHHIVLSMVGADRLAPVSGYHAAKMLQEHLVAAGPIHHTVVRAAQSFELLLAAAEFGAHGDTVRVPPALVQPIDCADIAESLAIAAVSGPLDDAIEVSGPVTYRFDEIIRIAFVARGDRRAVIADPAAPFRGIRIDERALLPARGAVRFETRFEDWLRLRVSKGPGSMPG
ncbi:SDR family oxidoreductase [Mycobacterium sp. C31M]